MFEEDIEAGKEAHGAVTGGGGGAFKEQSMLDFLRHPALLACIEELVGVEIIGSSVYRVRPMVPAYDRGEVPWHQDGQYWPITPLATCSVWLAIDDADVDNGCMRFIAGSHLHGQLEFRQSDASENNVLNQTVDEVERYGTTVDVELKAGQISIHSDLLLHSSHYNESDRRRCGLTLRYCTPDVRAIPGYDWEKEGVLISGADPDGHWGNPPRPERDHAVDQPWTTRSKSTSSGR